MLGKNEGVHALNGGLGSAVRVTAAASSADPLVPVVCRACSRVTQVTLSAIHSLSALPCGGCGAKVDVAAISATLPRVVKASRSLRPRARPLSEFP